MHFEFKSENQPSVRWTPLTTTCILAPVDAVLEERAEERQELDKARLWVGKTLSDQPQSFEEFVTAVLERSGPLQVRALKTAIWDAIERRDAELLSGFKIRRRAPEAEGPVG